MKSNLVWKSGMQFEATSEGNSVMMDAKMPLGKNQAMTPKEMVITGLGGCTAMDVIALLKKHKQACESLRIEVEVFPTTGRTPGIFTNAVIKFSATGNIDKNIFLQSVELSQTKYCGVSEMLSKAFPIQYVVLLNNEEIGRGKANFPNQ